MLAMNPSQNPTLCDEETDGKYLERIIQMHNLLLWVSWGESSLNELVDEDAHGQGRVHSALADWNCLVDMEVLAGRKATWRSIFGALGN
ncbi:hypothetical protein Taro_006023 [Colocasia esculenta]|uniref:Uncharacterized protein n=1 Tax=Colocasia esculenta TaxID=4460 RepID=A0A843TW98_COLES|nr:hypothetical protein [Colocasia esculenta]